MLGRLEIAFAQNLDELHQLHLDPRGWEAVVVELLRQLVLNDLLEDDDEGWSQVPVFPGILFDLVKVQGERSSHDTGLSIAQGLLDLVLVVRDGVACYFLLNNQSGTIFCSTSTAFFRTRSVAWPRSLTTDSLMAVAMVEFMMLSREVRQMTIS